MGWISKRAHTGNRVGGTDGMSMKDRGPLRKISYRIHRGTDIFSADYVHLECGHETHAWGQYKARCGSCKVELETAQTQQDH